MDSRHDKYTNKFLKISVGHAAVNQVTLMRIDSLFDIIVFEMPNWHARCEPESPMVGILEKLEKVS